MSSKIPRKALSKDCAFENFEMSFREESEELELLRGMIGLHFRLPLEMTEFHSQESNRSFYGKSAFILPHYAAGNLALRSLCDAMCGSYMAASILLRSVFELDLKGALYQCLTEEKYLSNTGVLESRKEGRNLLEFLNRLFDYSPNVRVDLQENSIGIFDKLEFVMGKREYHVWPSVIFRQLEAWDFFKPIKNAYETVYRRLYPKLSSDVHAIFDRTDIGKFLLKDPEHCFETPRVDQHFLRNYLNDLRDIMEIGIILTFNMLKESLEYEKTKNSLKLLINEFSHVVDELPHFKYIYGTMK